MLGALAEGVFEASESPGRERGYGTWGGKRLHAPGGHLPFSAGPRTVPYPLFRCLIRCLCLNTVPTPNGEAQLLVGDRHPNRANWRNRSPGPPILTLELRLANHAAATPGALRRRQRSCPGHASAWLPSTRRLRARTAARRCSEHSSRTRSTVTVEHQICSERALRVSRCRWRVAHASSASVPSARARGASWAKPSRLPIAHTGSHHPAL